MLRIKDRDRLVRVAWGEPQLTFPVEIQIKAYDRQGLMGDISSLLTNENINVKDIKINITHNLAYLDLVVEISDIAQLSACINQDRKLAKCNGSSSLETWVNHVILLPIFTSEEINLRQSS